MRFFSNPNIHMPFYPHNPELGIVTITGPIYCYIYCITSYPENQEGIFQPTSPRYSSNPFWSGISVTDSVTIRPSWSMMYHLSTSCSSLLSTIHALPILIASKTTIYNLFACYRYDIYIHYHESVYILLQSSRLLPYDILALQEADLGA